MLDTLKKTAGILSREIPMVWEERLKRAIFAVLACHCTLIGGKVPNQTSAQGNPFAFPLNAEEAELWMPPAAGPYRPASAGGGAGLHPRGGGGHAGTPPAHFSVTPPSRHSVIPPSRHSVTPPSRHPVIPRGGGGPARVVYQSFLAHDPSAVAAFTGEPGWAAPAAAAVTAKLDALSFGGSGAGVPSPVRLADAAGVAARTVFLAARGSAAALATLLDAPEPARLCGADGAGEALAGLFVPDAWRVFAVDFEEEADLGSLFFGGSAGRPEWRREWRGEIAEVVCFDAPPDADVRAGVAHCLALRWGAKGVPPATDAQRRAAAAAGLHAGGVWGTLVILR